MSADGEGNHRQTSERFKTARHCSQASLQSHRIYFIYRLENQGVSFPGVTPLVTQLKEGCVSS